MDVNLHEDEPLISFHSEEISFQFSQPDIYSNWISQIIEQEDKTLSHINYIFCSDPYLLQINIEYLDHHYFTDIITFPLGKAPIIEGDIFISIDRVKENATSYEVSFETELARVMAHGVLTFMWI